MAAQAKRPGFSVRDEKGTQLVEFAVSLPFLVVLVVGIFDFGTALTIKQKLTTLARDSAYMSANFSTADLTGTQPRSIRSVRNLATSYMQAAQINSCGLNSNNSPVFAAPAQWTYNAAGNGCAGTFTLVIDRSYAISTVVSGGTTQVISTHVTISYPYRWEFNNVIRLLVPTANDAPGQIRAEAIVPNLY
jgi:Flp pilus assembly protein TadG